MLNKYYNWRINIIYKKIVLLQGKIQIIKDWLDEYNCSGLGRGNKYHGRALFLDRELRNKLYILQGKIIYYKLKKGLLNG